jgi:hypothetical protein
LARLASASEVWTATRQYSQAPATTKANSTRIDTAGAGPGTGASGVALHEPHLGERVVSAGVGQEGGGGVEADDLGALGQPASSRVTAPVPQPTSSTLAPSGKAMSPR